MLKSTHLEVEVLGPVRVCLADECVQEDLQVRNGCIRCTVILISSVR